MSFEQCYDFDSYSQLYDPQDPQDWSDLNLAECTDYVQSYSPTDAQTATTYGMGSTFNQNFDGSISSSYPLSATEPPESDK
jgi:hypothetical protein